MQDDQGALLVSPAAPKPFNKAPIPGLSSEGHERRHGRGHGHCHDAQVPEDSSSETARAATPGLDGLDECKPSVKNSGLGNAGLLGEGIIPLSGPAAPHMQQSPASPVPIKAASRPASRALTSGGPTSPTVSFSQASSAMIFSDLYKSPRTTFSKFRLSFPHGIPHGVPQSSDMDADLVSRDKARQKEAVKKYLAERIRNDWEFTWPPAAAPAPGSNASATAAPDEPAQITEIKAASATAEDSTIKDPGEEADSESDTESVYSTISEDPVHFRLRAEWTSDLSGSDEPQPRASPFRFDNPDAVGAAVHDSLETKRARRRRAVRDEAKWNPGLACFEARRNAWTGAKTVRVKPKPPSPVSPSSTRRLFWRHHRTQSSTSHGSVATTGSPPPTASPLQPTTTRNSTTTTSESDSGKSAAAPVERTTSRDSTPPVIYPVQTVIPIPPPLLPPQNPMRVSIQSSMYGSLYDKVVTQSLQPSCPVNLADMVRACVVGWKRDGEWPPKSSYPAPPAVHTPPAELIALRQRKAREQRGRNAGKAGNEAAVSATRRLSLGFFGGGVGNNSVGNKPPAPEPSNTNEKMEENGNPHRHQPQERSNSHSDEGGAGPSGKALFRRSLHKVLSLGQHGHVSGVSGNGNAPASPP